MRRRRTLPKMSGSTLAGLSERELWRRLSFKERFVYAARFTNGVVKVGYTDHPEKRYGQLATAARVDIDRAWASVLHLNATDNERALMGFCARVGRRHGRSYEFFEDVALDQVVAFAEYLPYQQTPDDEVDAHIARRQRWVEAGRPVPGSPNWDEYCSKELA